MMTTLPENSTTRKFHYPNLLALPALLLGDVSMATPHLCSKDKVMRYCRLPGSPNPNLANRGHCFVEPITCIVSFGPIACMLSFMRGSLRSSDPVSSAYNCWTTCNGISSISPGSWGVSVRGLRNHGFQEWFDRVFVIDFGTVTRC